MELRIRAYRPGDVDALIALFRDSVRRVAVRDYSPEQVRAWAPDVIDRDRWLRRRGSRPTWVAEAAGQIVGFTDLEPDGHVDMMFVHPDHQGQGVATALLAEVEAAARARRLDQLHTEASLTARPFFERRGFRVVTVQAVALRGQVLVNYRMAKRLG